MPASPDKVKFKPANVRAILEQISNGVPVDIAARACCVSPAAFYKWISRGEKDMDLELMNEHVKMVEAHNKLKSKRVQNAMKLIYEDKNGHKGAQWDMERSFWKYFGKPSELEMNERLAALEQKDGNPKQVDREESKTAGTDIKEASS